MFSRDVPPVQIDDRFIKAGDPPERVWVVIRFWTTVYGLPHVRMKDEGRGNETRIISLSALVDRHFYSPAPPKGKA